MNPDAREPTFKPSPLCLCGKVAHPSRRVAAWNLNRQKKYLKERGREKLGTLEVFYCVYSKSFHIGNTADEYTDHNQARAKNRGKC